MPEAEKETEDYSDGIYFVAISHRKNLGINRDNTTIIDGVTSIGKVLVAKTTFYKNRKSKKGSKISIFAQAEKETGRIILDGRIFVPINRLVKKLGLAVRY